MSLITFVSSLVRTADRLIDRLVADGRTDPLEAYVARGSNVADIEQRQLVWQSWSGQDGRYDSFPRF